MRIPLAVAAFVVAAPAFAADSYPLPPEAFPAADTPRGKLTKQTHTSQVFPGTVRDYWVYVPAQYDGSAPAAVMVFQDGGGYQNPTGGWRATAVMDTLIHQGAMPITVGIFVNPGARPTPKTPGERPFNRSVEYDTLSPKYATFLETEILPAAGKGLSLRSDAAGRAICGISSGGICAFTVAWERPDLFSKVISHVGSFTNIRHGDTYPGLIRKTPVKPIRVYLQDGAGDLDNEHGSWPLCNLHMAASLRRMGYDYKFVYGDGGHNSRHGAADLANAFRWIWRDWKETK